MTQGNQDPFAIVELTLGILVDAFVLHLGAWHKSWLFWVNLGMYIFPVGSVLVVKFNARAKQMVQPIMCIGTMLMGCFLWVYMDQLYEQHSQLQIQKIASGLQKYNFNVDSLVLSDLEPSDFVLFPSFAVLFTFQFLIAIQNLLFIGKGGPSSCFALMHLVQFAGFVTVMMCLQEAYDMWSIVFSLSGQIVYAIGTIFFKSLSQGTKPQDPSPGKGSAEGRQRAESYPEEHDGGGLKLY